MHTRREGLDIAVRNSIAENTNNSESNRNKRHDCTYAHNTPAGEQKDDQIHMHPQI